MISKYRIIITLFALLSLVLILTSCGFSDGNAETTPETISQSTTETASETASETIPVSEASETAEDELNLDEAISEFNNMLQNSEQTWMGIYPDYSGIDSEILQAVVRLGEAPCLLNYYFGYDISMDEMEIKADDIDWIFENVFGLIPDRNAKIFNQWGEVLLYYSGDSAFITPVIDGGSGPVADSYRLDSYEETDNGKIKLVVAEDYEVSPEVQPEDNTGISHYLIFTGEPYNGGPHGIYWKFDSIKFVDFPLTDAE